MAPIIVPDPKINTYRFSRLTFVKYQADGVDLFNVASGCAMQQEFVGRGGLNESLMFSGVYSQLLKHHR